MTHAHRTSSASTTRPLPRLDALPDEVLTSILLELDARSLLCISLVSRRFQPLANENLVWRSIALRNFTYWDSQHDIHAKIADSTFQDWKGLYTVRHTANIATARCVQLLIHEPVGRLARMSKVLNHGYGIKDALIRLYHSAEGTECVLAQRFWVDSLLGCVNRAVALDTWTRIRYRSDIANPTETALAALDMFILGAEADGDINDTFRRLDEMVAALRAAYPDIDEQPPRTKAIVAAEFLRRKKWVGIEEGRDYYSIENQFLGLALRSWHRNSLPLVTCVIYCYVCRGLGLRAQPCSFPMHVHAVVQPPLPSSPDEPRLDLDGQPLPSDFLERSQGEGMNFADLDVENGAEPPNDLTHLYIDPFNTHLPISLSTLQTQLQFVAPQASRAQRATYLLPATPRSLLVRCAHNIIRAIRVETEARATNPNPTPPRLPLSIYGAAYAALYALVLFPSNAPALSASLDDLRAHFAHHFSEDLRNYEMYILPLTTGLGVFGGDRGIVDPLVRDVRREDERVPDVKRRRPLARRTEGENLDAGGLAEGEVEGDGDEDGLVKYTVGTVFRHRRQGYIAVIYGWDVQCEMGERWILVNRVDGLPGGRAQPFYNAYVDDKSTRYVAQENVIPLSPQEFTAEDAASAFDVQVGRWFKRYDPLTARFVSNVRQEYPDD